MCCVEINCFDLGKGRDMVGFCVKAGSLIRGRRSVAHSDGILYEPFVDCFGWMCHKDSAFEVCLCKDIREGSGMVEMKTIGHFSSATWSSFAGIAKGSIVGMGWGISDDAAGEMRLEKGQANEVWPTKLY